jgi:predicted hotdog family 3-hydroxylacyl-ACP dehydratase
LLSLLPHTPPMRLVHEVVSVDPGRQREQVHRVSSPGRA